MVPTEADDELDLRHYLDVVRRRKWTIIVVTAVVAAVALALSLSETPQYQTSARVLLQGDDAEQRLGATQLDPRVVTGRVETEIGVMGSDLVRQAVAENLGRGPSVSISAVGETEIVQIAATSLEPEEAAETANVYAETYVEWKRERTIDDLLAAQQTVQAEIRSLEDQLAEVQAPLEALEEQLFFSEDEDERELIRAEIQETEDEIQAEVDALQNAMALYRTELSSLQVSQGVTRTGGAQIISQAGVPSEPFSPKPLRNGLLGAVVGAMLGVGLAFLRETLDDRVRSREELERITGWPTVGLIPVIPAAGGDGTHDLATLESPNSPAAEAYRTLRTTVQFIGLERPLEVLQVTSAKPAEGKTTTAANLAIALARAGKRVILLDADLRKPRLHSEFGISNATGFTSMLLDARLDAKAFHRTSLESLLVVPAGPIPPNPSELLSLPATRQVLGLLRSECDVLIIDSPPVLPVTDALILSGYVDGVLVVANAKEAQVSSLKRMRELLEQVNAQVIGVSVNYVDAESGSGYGYGYGYGYGEQAEPEEQKRTGRRSHAAQDADVTEDDRESDWTPAGS